MSNQHTHDKGVNIIYTRLSKADLYQCIGREKDYGITRSRVIGEIDAYAVHNGLKLSDILLFEYKSSNIKTKPGTTARHQLAKEQKYLQDYFTNGHNYQFIKPGALDEIVSNTTNKYIRVRTFYVHSNPPVFELQHTYDFTRK